MYPAENILQNQDKSSIQNANNNQFPANNSNNNNNNNDEMGNQAISDNMALSRQQQQPQNSQIIGSDDLRYHGTELVMLYDYKVI